MGFSGGGSNILKAHTHNGLTVQDGGALDFDDITQSQSSAGMVFYSDGTHLQQLAYPGSPAGETLTAAALSSAPSWGAAGGAGGNYVFVERFTGTAASTLTCVLATPIPIADFSRLVCVFNGKFAVSWPAASGELNLQISNNLTQPLTAAQYASQNCVTSSAGVARVAGGTTEFTLCESTSDAGAIISCVFELLISTSNYHGSGFPSSTMVGWQSYGQETINSGGGKCYNATGNITTVNGFYLSNSAGNNFEAGATLDVYKVTT